MEIEVALAAAGDPADELRAAGGGNGRVERIADLLEFRRFLSRGKTIRPGRQHVHLYPQQPGARLDGHLGTDTQVDENRHHGVIDAREKEVPLVRQSLASLR